MIAIIGISFLIGVALAYPLGYLNGRNTIFDAFCKAAGYERKLYVDVELLIEKIKGETK